MELDVPQVQTTLLEILQIPNSNKWIIIILILSVILLWQTYNKCV